MKLTKAMLTRNLRELTKDNRELNATLDMNRREVSRLSEMLTTARQTLNSVQHDLAMTRVAVRKLSKENHCYESLLKMLNSELLSARIEIQSQRYAEPEQQVDIKVHKAMSAAIIPAKP